LRNAPKQLFLVKDNAPARVRFGGIELDLKAGELCSGDHKILLQEQPFRILLMLVQRYGEIVTREEIQKKCWPNDTVVDFDHSINAAMRKLRQALGDSSKQPKYIETVGRRGYRLLVPVEQVPGVVHSAVAEGSAANVVGKKVSHYRVLEIIGGGGMGVVYRAEDLKLGRQVALKFLPEELAWDPAALKRFEREARAASSLDHPNICTIYEVEEHEDQPFLVMQLLDGETLRDRMAAGVESEKRMSLDEVLHIAIGVVQGLQAAHEKGVIHRDIKPANIFLTTAGQVKILDFGIAKLVDSAKDYGSDQLRLGADGAILPRPSGSADTPITRFGATMGTAGYMSPEQVRGENLDARTDIFSFGLVLYEMATSKRAFTGETAEIVHHAVVNQVQVPARDLNSDLPLELERIIDKTLEKDRARRYQSAAEARRALSHLQREKERDGLGRRRMEIREAYLLHEKAMYWANKWTPDALQKAFRFTQQAIEADPVYAEAYGDFAFFFGILWFMV
jgi:eukaryotic-like serine/threonine-protein kinase